MVTEILGLLIVVGTLLVLLMRYLTKRQSQPQVDQQEIQQSTVRFKEELERSGDAIVARLGNHVSHLEELIREADARSAMLEAKLVEQRRLEEELSDREESVRLLLEQARVDRQRAQALPAVSEPVRVDANDFAAVLQNSIKREPVEPDHARLPLQAEEEPLFEASLPAENVYREPATPPDEEQDPGLEEILPPKTQQETEKTNKILKSGEPNPGTSAAKARAMLLSGYSIEETSRDTGLGIRAVELIREMNRRDIESK